MAKVPSSGNSIEATSEAKVLHATSLPIHSVMRAFGSPRPPTMQRGLSRKWHQLPFAQMRQSQMCVANVQAPAPCEEPMKCCPEKLQFVQPFLPSLSKRRVRTIHSSHASANILVNTRFIASLMRVRKLAAALCSPDPD